MVDLAELEETIKTSIAKTNNDIGKIDSKELSQREKFVSNITKHIDEIKENLELYDYTCLDYTKKPEFPSYKKKYAELRKQYEDLKATFEKKKNADSGRSSVDVSRAESIPDPKSVAGLIATGNKTQDATLEALDRIGAKVDDAHIIADSIMTEEERQLESLKKTLGNIKDTKSDIKTARKIVSYFAKEVYKDLFWRIAFIIIIIILLLIIVKSLLNNFGSTPPSTIPYDYFNGYN